MDIATITGLLSLLTFIVLILSGLVLFVVVSNFRINKIATSLQYELNKQRHTGREKEDGM